MLKRFWRKLHKRPARILKLAASGFSTLSAAIAALFLVLGDGDLHTDFVNARLSQELAALLGPGSSASIRSSELNLVEGGVAVMLGDIRLTQPDGQIIRIAEGVARLDGSALLSGEIRPLALEVSGGAVSLDLQKGIHPADPGEMLVTGSVQPAGLLPANLLETLLRPAGQHLDLVIRDMTLTIVPPGGGERMVLEGIRLETAMRSQVPELRLNVPAFGPAALIRLSASTDVGKAGTNRLMLQASGLSLDSLAALTGKQPPFPIGITVALAGEIDLDASGAPVEARLAASASPDSSISGGTSAGSGLSANLFWQAGRDLIAFSSLETHLAGWRLGADGQISHTGGLTRLDVMRAAIEPPSGAAGLVLTDLSFAASAADDGGLITLDKLNATFAGTRVSATATLSGWKSDAPSFKGNVHLGPGDLMTLAQALPKDLMGKGAEEFFGRMQAGTLQDLTISFSIGGKRLIRALASHTIPLEAFEIRGAYKNVDLAGSGDLPPMSGMTGTMQLDAATLMLDAKQATIHLPKGARHTLDSMSLRLDKPYLPDPNGLVKAVFSGAIGDLRDKILLLPIEKKVKEGIGSLGDSGSASARLSFPLGAQGKVLFDDLVLDATLKGASVKALGTGPAITAADLVLSQDKGKVSIRGTGKLNTLPVNISFSARSPRDTGKTQLTATVDDGTRKRMGFPFGKALKGPVYLTIEPDMAKPDTARLSVDLTKVAISDLVPGWNKPAGRKASATTTLRDRGKDGLLLENLVLEGGSLRARGAISLGPEGQFRQARLTSISLPGGEEGSATISLNGALWVVDLAANSLDARPWLKRLDQMAAGGKLPVALSVSATALQGHNGEIISGARLESRIEKGRPQEASFTGRINGKPMNARITPRNKAMRVHLTAGDAGGLLRFLDVYTRMEGGLLDSRLTIQGGQQIGAVLVQNFALVNEPALRGIVAQTGASSDSRTDFSVARLRFDRFDGRLTLTEAVMWGDEIGGNITGEIDYPTDRIALSGSFVPAYALNNFFAKLPLVGVLLGGDSYEGLFAVPFTITGQASRPRLTVNTLSAVAPGILRKLLEFREKPGLDPVL